jgi:hypothetical protein
MGSENSLLDRRRIEAEILKHAYDTLKEEWGEAKARELLTRIVEKAAVEAGKAMALKEKGPTGPRTLAAIQPLWQKGGALKTKVLRLDGDAFDYEVTYCAYRDMYRDMGLSELGYILSCCRDEAFVKGYAPDLTLERDTTLMTGDPRCLFRYRRKNPT